MFRWIHRLVWSRVRFLSLILPALLILISSPTWARMALQPQTTAINLGESLVISLEGGQPGKGVNWQVTPELKLLDADGSKARVRGSSPGNGKITAYARGDMASASIRVNKTKQASGPLNLDKDRKVSGMLRVLNLPSKRDRLAVMMAAVSQDALGAEQFFKEMAAMGATKDDLIDVKKKLEAHAIQTGNNDLSKLVLGEGYPEGGTKVEKKLLEWRKKVTDNAIKAAIQFYIAQGRVPANNFKLMIAYVGKWASQHANALTFPGDIDFSFVCNDMQLARDLKAKFDEYIKATSGLSPVDLDSVATVHGNAGLEVYIGKHGQFFAEQNMQDNRVVDMATGNMTEMNAVGMRVTLALERSAADAAGIEVRKPTVDMDPGLSMEMVRHFDNDIVKPGVYGIRDSVMKAAKYLYRSNVALKKTGGGKPANATLAKLAQVAYDLERLKPQTQKVRDQLTDTLAEYFGVKPKAVWDSSRKQMVLSVDPAQIARFHSDVKNAMWQNVIMSFRNRHENIQQRYSDLLRRKKNGEKVAAEAEHLRAELLKLLDMVKAEITAFGDPGKVNALVVQRAQRVQQLLDDLAKRTGVRKLSLDELKDKKLVEEMLKARSKNARRMVGAYVMHKALKAAEVAVQTGERVNNILDFVDDGVLGQLRGETGFAALEHELFELRQLELTNRSPTDIGNKLLGMKNRVKGAIAQTNRKLNEMIQSTATGRQGAKLLMITGLVDEMKAYGNALWEGDWGSFAAEVLRRRMPGASIAEHAYMGNNLLATWDLVTTLVPPIGMAHAVGSMLGQAYAKSSGIYWNEQLELFSDGLYKDAEFELTEVQGHQLDKSGSYEVQRAGKAAEGKPQAGWKLGVYRLKATYYNNLRLDLSGFAKMRKEQVEALRKQVNSSRLTAKDKAGKVDAGWRAYKQNFQGFTEWLEVSDILRNNLTATDPALILLEELSKHEIASEMYQLRLAEQGLARWEEIKLGYILNLIEHLEKRKQADSALERGVLPDLFAALRGIARDLQIEAETLKSLDAEAAASNYKALVNWLWSAKRGAFGQAANESEISRAAQVVLRYLDVYRQVVKIRAAAISKIKPEKYRTEGSQQWIRGKLFLRGQPDADLAAARKWARYVQLSNMEVYKALLEIKHAFLPNTLLESEQELALVERAWRFQLWMKPYLEAGKMARSNAWLDRAIGYGRKRNQIYDDYRDSLRRDSPVQLTLVLSDAKDPEQVIKQSNATAKPTDELGKAAVTSGSDRLVLNLVMGRYRIAVEADGYNPHTLNETLGANLDKAPMREIALVPQDIERVDKDEEDNALDETGEGPDSGMPAVTVEGPEQVTLGEQVTLKAQITGFSVKARTALKVSWRDYSSNKVLAAGDSWTFKADQPGTLQLVALAEGKDASGHPSGWFSEVHELTTYKLSEGGVSIKADKITKVGWTVGLQTELGEQMSGLPGQRYEWLPADVEPYGGNPGYAQFKPDKPGNYRIQVKVYARIKGKEKRVGSASHQLIVPNNKLDMPSEVMEGETLQLTAPPQDALQNRIKRTLWRGVSIYDPKKKAWSSWGGVDAPSVKAHIPVRHFRSKADKPRQAMITVNYKDADDQHVAHASGKALILPALFNGSASDIWKGGTHQNDRSHFTLTRDKSVSAPVSGPDGKPTSNGYVKGKISLALGRANARLDEPGEISEYMTKEAKRWGHRVIPFAIGSFKGYAMERPQLKVKRGGGSGWTGWHGSSTSREFSARLVNGASSLSVAFHVSGGGAIDNSNLNWLITKSNAVYEEAKGIVASFGFAVDGSFKHTAYKGPALDGSDDAPPLALTLSGPDKPLRVGQTAEVTSVVKGGKAPYAYTWSGDHAGKGARVTLLAQRPGEHGLSLQVSSEDGQSASADLSYRVEGIGAKISGLPATVVYASEHAISVALPPTIRGAKVIWQSEPNLTFDPVESTDGKARLLFDRRPDDGARVWAQILDAQGSTIGEADQVTVKVDPPRLSLTFTPAAEKVGQEVKASIGIGSKIADTLIDFRWLEPRPALRKELGNNANAITFVPRDTRPMAFQVQARVPGSGDDLGELKANYTASPYRVSAKVVESGLKPRIWQPGKGLTDAPRGTHATDQRITVKAGIKDHPRPSDVRWQWTANEGTNLSNPNSRTPTVTRHEPGSASLSVLATDEKKIELGRASLSFTVSATSEAVARKAVKKTSDKPGKIPAKPDQTAAEDPTKGQQTPAAKADKMLAEANTQARRGNLEGAAVAVEKARKIDHSRAAETGRTLAAEVIPDAKLAEKAWDFDRSEKLFNTARRLDPPNMEAAQGVNRAAPYRKRKRQIEAWRKDATGALDRRDLERAAQRLRDIALWENIMPDKGNPRPETTTIRTRYDKALAAYNHEMDAFKKDITTGLKAKRYDQVEKKARARLQKKPLLGDERNWLDALVQTSANRKTSQAAVPRPASSVPREVAHSQPQGGSGPAVAGTWSYRSGNDYDTFTLAADGRAFGSKIDPDNTGNWRLEGDVLVVRWKNAWTNRYRIDDSNGPFRGQDIDPQGKAYTSGRLGRVATRARKTASRERFRLVSVPGGISFHQARTQAGQMGGHLAVITSQAESTEAFAAANDTTAWQVNSFGDSLGPWLGGYRATKTGGSGNGWAWLNGESWSFSAWAPGEPNNYQGRETHLHYFSSKSKNPANTWNDAPPDLKMKGFLVEFDGMQSGKADTATQDGSSETLTSGWDRRDHPLQQGNVSWSATPTNGGHIEFRATYELQGAKPNHSYTVGVHFFEPKGSSVEDVTEFGGWRLPGKRSMLTRDGVTATVTGAWDFGNLRTNAQGNARTRFSFKVPAREYHLQFSVRHGECKPSQGKTAGCAAVFHSGTRFGQGLVVFGSTARTTSGIPPQQDTHPSVSGTPPAITDDGIQSATAQGTGGKRGTAANDKTPTPPANTPVPVKPATAKQGNKALSLPSAVVAPGQQIKLHFTADSKLPGNAWVGLIPASVPHGSTKRNYQRQGTHVCQLQGCSG